MKERVSETKSEKKETGARRHMDTFKLFKMALARASSQDIDRMQAQKMLDKKMNKAKGELVKLQQCYDTAVDDIQKHYCNASAALTAIKEKAVKALDTYMLKYQKRLREEIKSMRELQESLSSSALNDKMDKDGLSDDDSMGMTNSHDQAVASIIEMYVEKVPCFRFLGNEAFLFQVTNGNFLPYFGSITVDNKILATDLHLHGTVDPYDLCYTFRIDVPNGLSDIEDMKSKIKCQLYDKERRDSVYFTPVWATDHFEIKVGFPKKTTFSLGVYFLEQHISGSPVDDNLDSGILQTANSDIKDMEVVKQSTKRTLGMSDSLVEAALHEINSSIDTNNNSNSINNSNNSHNKSNKNNSDNLEVNLQISGRTCKISKRTKLPFSPSDIKSVQPLFEVPKASRKESVTSIQDSGVSCSSVGHEEPVIEAQEKQGVRAVINYRRTPYARPLPCIEEECCSIPIHKIDAKYCPNNVVDSEKNASKKKQSTVEQPIETTIECFGDNENSSRKICFPNKFISHTFHPDVCRRFPRRKGNSPEDFARVLARLTQSSRSKEVDSETEDVLVEEEVSYCEEDIPLPEEELVKQESLNGEDVFQGQSLGNLMIKTVPFNVVEAKLSFVTSIEAPHDLNRPVGVLEHSSGNIIVSDTFNDRVLILNNDGAPIGLAGPSMGFRRPSSIVELWDGSFAVICSSFIALFDAKGTYTNILGKNLLQKPYGLSLTQDGKLLTVETAYLGSLVIVTYCPELKMELSRLRVPLQLHANQEGLSKPRFMTSYKDKIYVGDLGLNCIYEVCYTSGCLLSIFGSTGSEPGRLVDPSGISCDPNGNIFVADSRNHRIQVFDDCKRFICIIDVDYPLNRPSGIYLACSDHLLVLNYWENSIAKYHLTYKFI